MLRRQKETLNAPHTTFQKRPTHVPKETYSDKKRPTIHRIPEVCVSVKRDLSYSKRDLSSGKRDLSHGKRDLSYGKRDLFIGKIDLLSGKKDLHHTAYLRSTHRVVLPAALRRVLVYRMCSLIIGSVAPRAGPKRIFS